MFFLIEFLCPEVLCTLPPTKLKSCLWKTKWLRAWNENNWVEPVELPFYHTLISHSLAFKVTFVRFAMTSPYFSIDRQIGDQQPAEVTSTINQSRHRKDLLQNIIIYCVAPSMVSHPWGLTCCCNCKSNAFIGSWCLLNCPRCIVWIDIFPVALKLF